MMKEQRGEELSDSDSEEEKEEWEDELVPETGRGFPGGPRRKEDEDEDEGEGEGEGKEMGGGGGIFSAPLTIRTR